MPTDPLSQQEIPPAPDSPMFSREHRSPLVRHFDGVQFLIGVFLVIFHLLIFYTGRFNRVELMFLDGFFQNRPAAQPDPSLLLIEIDDESLKDIGPWPWPWLYHAEIINRLAEWGAKAVLFDFGFHAEQAEDQGAMLAEAMRKSQSVYLTVEMGAQQEKKIWVHALPIVLQPKSDQKVWTHAPKMLEDAAEGVGHHELEPDADGVLRRVQPVLEINRESYPYLGLRAALDFKRDLAAENFPLDPQGKLMINWSGPWQDVFPHLSYAEVIRSGQALEQGLRPSLDPALFKDKICLIGLHAQSLSPLKSTPMGSDVPPMAVHAQVINNLLQDRMVRTLSFKSGMLTLLLFGLGVALLFASVRSVPALLLSLAIAAGWLMISYLLFRTASVWLLVFHPWLVVLTLLIFSAIYQQIAAARERKRLVDLATRDGLTGLYVIRHFREILNQTVLEVQKSREPLSLVLIDVDNFKKVNDTYGHPAGDMVLKKTAQIIHSKIRSNRPLKQVDFAARYGGEEMVIMLRGLAVNDAAVRVADRIRKAVEQADFVWDGQKIKVTISLGVAGIREGENVPDMMVRRADKALYEAKRQGKNRVCTQTFSLG